MFKFTIMIENTEREEQGFDGISRADRFFSTKGEVENLSNNPELLSDIADSLFNLANDNGSLDPVEDDGDTYNGDTTNDINA